jgi:predicted esterase
MTPEQQTPYPSNAARRPREWPLAVAAAVMGGIGLGCLAGSAVFGVLAAIAIASVGMLLACRRRTTLPAHVIEIALFAAGLFLTAYFVRDTFTRTRWTPSPPGASAQAVDNTIGLAATKTTYRLIAPSATGNAVPVVLLLHGNGGSPLEIMRDTGWDRICRERGWVLVVPQSPATTWGDDAEATVIAALHNASRQAAIDTKRILLTGRSDGATQCYALGMRRPDVFRAIGVSAGAYWPLMPLHVFRSRRVAAYIYHGGADGIFPVAEARRCASWLRWSGHAVTYHEDPQGGHTYTPAEAQSIADWFGGLPPAAKGKSTTNIVASRAPWGDRGGWRLSDLARESVRQNSFTQTRTTQTAPARGSLRRG